MNGKQQITPRRKSAARIGLGILGLIALACTCGPLSQLQGLQGTAGAARGTLGAFATTIDENLPTLEAQLTELGPTLEAQMTEFGPTVEAQLTKTGPTLEALQTAAVDILPTLQAQLTQVGPTVQAGLEGETRQWATYASASTQFGEDSWSANQALGAPNSLQCGDQPTAWASANPNSLAWLNLGYDVAVAPTRIEIHQSFNPGAIFQVELVYPGGGYKQIVYEADPVVGDTCPFTLVIPITGVTTKIGQVLISVNQTAHPSWNEIDAVELIGIP